VASNTVSGPNATAVRIRAKTIVVSSCDQVTYDLDDLLAAITASNIHKKVDFGRAVGREGF